MRHVLTHSVGLPAIPAWTTVEDLMIRHARMRGHPALFLPGLDHASIAAQFVLDAILAKEGESRQSLGRERYLERMIAFSESTRPVMLAQQRRVGASADWGRLRYTMDDASAKSVRVAFERLAEAMMDAALKGALASKRADSILESS